MASLYACMIGVVFVSNIQVLTLASLKAVYTAQKMKFSIISSVNVTKSAVSYTLDKTLIIWRS